MSSDTHENKFKNNKQVYLKQKRFVLVILPKHNSKSNEATNKTQFIQL
jgi:hypothetical protein